MGAVSRVAAQPAVQVDGYHDVEEANVAVVTPVGVPTGGEPVLQWGLALDDIQVRSDANIGNVDVLGSGDDILFYNPSESSAGLYNS